MGTQVAETGTGSDRAERPRRRQAWRINTGSVNVGRNERIVSTVAGGLLAAWGLRRRGRAGYSMALMGAELIYRGVTGHCHTYSALGMDTTPHERPEDGTPAEIDHAKTVDVRHSIMINRPAAELFAMWRDFSQLPRFMDHLERVDVLSNTRSHWVTKGPIGTHISWDAEIVDERENEWIAWRAVEPAQVPNNGTVMFREVGGVTEVFVTLEAQPPAGKLGDMVARMFGKSPDRQVRVALKRFKELAEGSNGKQQGKAEGANTGDNGNAQ
jgi:uncharacterized membrane protein